MTQLEITDLRGKLPLARAWARRSLGRITRIVLHHSAAPAPDPASPNTTEAQLRAFARHHIAQGYRGLAYHFAIDAAGRVYKCNDLQDLTSHAKGGNSDSIGIVLLGNFDQHRIVGGKVLPSLPTAAQLRSARLLVDRLAAMPSVVSITPHRRVKGSATVCPGRYFTDAMVQALWPG